MPLLPGTGSAPLFYPQVVANKEGAKIIKDFLSPAMPSLPPLVPPPSREDPEISAARKKQRMAELQRRGRQSMILTTGENDLGYVSRPQAREARLLGE